MQPDQRPAGPTSPAEFFDDAQRQFHLAQSKAGVHERWYDVAGQLVRLRFAGDALLPVITPALEHRRLQPNDIDPARAPALTVCLWDAASTGVPLPERPWGTDDNLARGDIRDFADPHIRTAYTLGPNALSMLDERCNVGLFCTTSAAHIPTDYRGSPLLVILSWWTSQQGLQYVHGGAVGTPQGGVLLVGKGGSGKSTSALSCIGSDLLYAADDYCLVDARAAVPFVHSIYCSAKLVPEHSRKFPHLVPHISNVEDLDKVKAVIYLHPPLRANLVPGFPIKAILIPRVTGLRDTTLSPATAPAGLKALAPSTLFQLSGAGAGNFGYMASLVRRVPCLYLNAGTDLAQIPRVIHAYLTGAGAPTGAAQG